jgi:type I restriction enzyme S subunit
MIGWFGSNNLARLRDSLTDLEFLYAFLATPYGRHQLKKEIYGGVVDHINEEHIATALCPDVPRDLQKAIGNIVRDAFELKDRAEEIEDAAIAGLVHAITGEIRHRRNVPNN